MVKFIQNIHRCGLPVPCVVWSTSLSRFNDSYQFSTSHCYLQWSSIRCCSRQPYTSHVPCCCPISAWVFLFSVCHTPVFPCSFLHTYVKPEMRMALLKVLQPLFNLQFHYKIQKYILTLTHMDKILTISGESGWWVNILFNADMFTATRIKWSYKSHISIWIRWKQCDCDC